MEGLGGYLKQVSLIVVFLLLNSLLNLANKWSLGIFPYPILLTSCHMASTVIFLTPVMLLRYDRLADKFRRQWIGICAIGTTIALNVSLNNTSMLHMTLSLNQVIRSSMPVFTCLMAYPVEKKTPKPLEVLALVTLSTGIMTCVWQNDAAGTLSAILLCLLATVCNSAMSCFAGKVMSEALEALELIYFTAPVSLLVLLPYLVYKELPKIGEAVGYQGKGSGWSFGYKADLSAILISTSLLAIVYNFVHISVIKATSAVTTTVLGQIKVAGVVLLSAILLGESSIFNLQMIIGSITAFAGFIAYSYLKLIAKQEEVRTKALDAAEKASGTTQVLLGPRTSTEGDDTI